MAAKSHDHICAECGAIYPCPDPTGCPCATTEERIGLCPGCGVEIVGRSEDGFEAIIRPSSKSRFRVREPMSRTRVKSTSENARRLLHEMSESLDVDPGKVAHVEGQFITPAGNQVYRVRLGGKTEFVTIPED
jgi:hypothetical protein